MNRVEGPIEGYKLFNIDFTNRYGKLFKVGETYKDEKTISSWIDGNGFHFCRNYYDTFRYFDTREGFVLTKVIGNEKIYEYNDEYYGYYDMYSASEITIKQIVSRKEIIEMTKKYIDFIYSYSPINKIFMTFPITEEEFNVLLNSTNNIYSKEALLYDYNYYQGKQKKLHM